MKMSDLVRHLLQHRFRYGNTVILDCLALADLVSRHDPWQRFQVVELSELLGVSNGAPSYLSYRLRQLVRAGLLEYQAGVPYDPGYLFLRVGPEVTDCNDACRVAPPRPQTDPRH